MCRIAVEFSVILFGMLLVLLMRAAETTSSLNSRCHWRLKPRFLGPLENLTIHLKICCVTADGNHTPGCHEPPLHICEKRSKYLLCSWTYMPALEVVLVAMLILKQELKFARCCMWSLGHWLLFQILFSKKLQGPAHRI